jgi:hypothetical protein
MPEPPSHFDRYDLRGFSPSAPHALTHSHRNFEKNFCLPKRDTKLHPSC